MRRIWSQSNKMTKSQKLQTDMSVWSNKAAQVVINIVSQIILRLKKRELKSRKLKNRTVTSYSWDYSTKQRRTKPISRNQFLPKKQTSRNIDKNRAEKLVEKITKPTMTFTVTNLKTSKRTRKMLKWTCKICAWMTMISPISSNTKSIRIIILNILSMYTSQKWSSCLNAASIYLFMESAQNSMCFIFFRKTFWKTDKFCFSTGIMTVLKATWRLYWMLSSASFYKTFLKANWILKTK